jgi:hypothetical protein
LLGPIAALAAVIYFLIDALFLSFIRPIAQALARLGMFSSLAAWVGSLGPYPTLALFLIPIAVLEPAKPLGAYLMATGHVTYGVLVIATGEVFKITIVERLFHFSRDKLMSIAAFAWVYGWITRWLGCLQAQPIWRATLARATAIKTAARRTSIARVAHSGLGRGAWPDPGGEDRGRGPAGPMGPFSLIFEIGPAILAAFCGQ